MMNVQLDLTFPHQYEVELQNSHSESPEDRRIYFPNPSEDSGQGSLQIKISPNMAESWQGIFTFGYDSQSAVSGVYSCPDDKSVCVVSAGQGYIVKVDNPNIYEEVKAFPILDVRLVAESGLILFADFTTISAYGSNGVVWKTSRLSWDGIEITEVTPSYIKGLAWDASQEREVEFIVNVETGLHEGGSSPEKYC